ncbi:GRAM domain-containing protein [Nonlabens antarcticus]|uniref:GRAM domain-containing protein n=1 Tax=Nonlabens antarcticus TaxID=392714 RepID=UPI001890D172|nr:GRAM domain-containing protein [Nonlabens antarcticus]
MEIGTVTKLSWKVRVLYGLLSGVMFAVLMLAFDWIFSDELQSVYGYVFQGVFFGFFMGIAMVYSNKHMSKWMGFGKKDFANPELEPDEAIQIEGPANLFRGMEGVGGKLFLTNKKVIFNSHKLNIQKGQTNILYTDIEEIQERKTGFIVNNGIRIRTVDEIEYDFVVNSREQWLEELGKRVQFAGGKLGLD